MEFYEKTLNSKKIFEGRIINLRVDEIELPNGTRSTREIVKHPGAVAIVALNHEGEALMVRQYRKAVEEALLEIPAGKLENGETIETCAQRELMEETGYYAQNLSQITSIYTSPGFSNEAIHIFLAENLKREPRKADFDEYIQLEMLLFKDAVEKAFAGVFKDAKTVVGLLLAYNYLKGRD